MILRYNFIMVKTNSTLSKQIGKRIQEIRESKNIKQFELAEMLDIEPSNLSKIETGYYFPRGDKLLNIVDALGIELKDLFDVDHIKTKEELIKLINDYLSKLNEDELGYFYKSLKSYFEMIKKE